MDTQVTRAVHTRALRNSRFLDPILTQSEARDQCASSTHPNGIPNGKASYRVLNASSPLISRICLSASWTMLVGIHEQFQSARRRPVRKPLSSQEMFLNRTRARQSARSMTGTASGPLAYGMRVARGQSELTPPMLLKNERVVVEATHEWAAMHALWIDSRAAVCPGGRMPTTPTPAARNAIEAVRPRQA